MNYSTLTPRVRAEALENLGSASQAALASQVVRLANCARIALVYEGLSLKDLANEHPKAKYVRGFGVQSLYIAKALVGLGIVRLTFNTVSYKGYSYKDSAAAIAKLIQEKALCTQ